MEQFIEFKELLVLDSRGIPFFMMNGAFSEKECGGIRALIDYSNTLIGEPVEILKAGNRTFLMKQQDGMCFIVYVELLCDPVLFYTNMLGVMRDFMENMTRQFCEKHGETAKEWRRTSMMMNLDFFDEFDKLKRHFLGEIGFTARYKLTNNQIIG